MSNSLFNEKHKLNDKDDQGLDLIFIESARVQAFPCGRRRSEEIDADGNDLTVNDYYRLPFDPEARLNTEANNRKHSGLNGFTQTYLASWIEDDLVGAEIPAGTEIISNDDTKKGYFELVIAGYYFKISLNSDFTTPSGFAIKAMDKLGVDRFDKSQKSLYANIRIDETLLFSGLGTGFVNYKTGVLRNQNYEPSTCLDLLTTFVRTNVNQTQRPSEIGDFNNYYFSGLSFSLEPITGIDATQSDKPVIDAEGTVVQRMFSIRLLDYNGSTWKIHNPAWLPKIEHGDDDNSVRVGILEADSIKIKDTSVPSLKLVQLQPEQENRWQMQFSSVDIVEL